MHTWLGRMPAAGLFFLSGIALSGIAIGAPPAVNVIRSLTGQIETGDLSARADVSRKAAVRDMRSPEVRLRRERAVALIRSLGGSFDGDDAAFVTGAGATTAIDRSHPSARGVKAGTSAELHTSRTEAATSSSAQTLQPPPALPADRPLPGAAFERPAGDGLIADAYVSPEFADRPSAIEPEVSLTINQNWRGGDEGLRALSELGRINTLRLHRAPLSDAALESIARLPQLQTLRLEGCCLSWQAIQSLRQRQPQMRIIVSED